MCFELASKLPLELTVSLSVSAATGGGAERGTAREEGSFESETSGLPLVVLIAIHHLTLTQIAFLMQLILNCLVYTYVHISPPHPFFTSLPPPLSSHLPPLPQSQSDELQKLQVELQALKKEEAAMRLEVENDRAELQRVQQTVMDTKNQINRAQESVNALKDDQRNVNASLAMYSSIGVGGGISSSGAGAKGSYEGGLGDLSEDQSQLRREADSVSARATVSKA